MSAEGHHTAAQIRSRLDHPVIDGDGHWVEFDPVFSDRMRKVGGDKAGDGFLAAMKTTRDALSMSVAERRRRRIAQPGFWSRQAENTLDRATAMMPRLLYERLDEFGTDFAIIYPTAGLRVPRISDDETRRAVVRAHNIVTAEYFRDLGDRMTPAAIIPMHTPDEAIAEYWKGFADDPRRIGPVDQLGPVLASGDRVPPPCLVDKIQHSTFTLRTIGGLSPALRHRGQPLCIPARLVAPEDRNMVRIAVDCSPSSTHRDDRHMDPIWNA